MGVLSKDYHPSLRNKEAAAMKTVVGKAAAQLNTTCRALFTRAYQGHEDGRRLADEAYNAFDDSLSVNSTVRPRDAIPDEVKAFCKLVLDPSKGIQCGGCKEWFVPGPKDGVFVKAVDDGEIRYCSEHCFKSEHGSARGRNRSTPADAPLYNRPLLSEPRPGDDTSGIDDLFDS